MVDDLMSEADIETLYHNCLFIHEGALVKVHSISFGTNPATFTLINLSTGKSTKVVFDQDAFKVPEKRIGFVNIMKSVVYVVRLPLRRYHLGINANNIEVRTPDGIPYPMGRIETLSQLSNLNKVEVYNAYAGKYPSLAESVKNAKEWKGACAFDKQFAVDFQGKIYYKENCVGKMDGEVIKFDDEWKYLDVVLEKNYEKGSRTFKASSL